MSHDDITSLNCIFFTFLQYNTLMVITQHFKGSQIALKRKTDFYILLYFLRCLSWTFLFYFTTIHSFQPAEFDDTIQIHPTTTTTATTQALTCVLRVGAAAASAVLQLQGGGDFSGEGECVLPHLQPPQLTRWLSLRLFFFFMRY